MKVAQADIENFNKLYLKYKTYAEVARQTGFSPSTIKKYIIKDFVLVNEVIRENFVKYSETEDFAPVSFFEENNIPMSQWGKTFIPSQKEREELENLYKEISI
jgi:bisphosphoglycerate-independent phosphoglycerate mutase (AlkP superfamily)